MIFKHTWQEMVTGKKTTALRLAQDDEWLVEADSDRPARAVVRRWKTAKGYLERSKWEVGKSYAVQPGYSMPSVWVNRRTGEVLLDPRVWWETNAEAAFGGAWNRTQAHHALMLAGYWEARRTLCGIKRIRPEEITVDLVHREGFRGIEDFATIYQRENRSFPRLLYTTKWDQDPVRVFEMFWNDVIWRYHPEHFLGRVSTLWQLTFAYPEWLACVWGKLHEITDNGPRYLNPCGGCDWWNEYGPDSRVNHCEDGSTPDRWYAAAAVDGGQFNCPNYRTSYDDAVIQEAA